jgi:FixJ family two-component response regulator
MSGEAKHLIAVVDDERLMREAIENLLRSAGFSAEGFASAEDFLRASSFAATSCVVLDMQLPGMSGLELQQRMCELGIRAPIVFVSATDGHLREQGLRAGVLAFLGKPFVGEELLAAVRSAIMASPS